MTTHDNIYHWLLFHQSLDEHSHMIFVLDKLSELLELLVEPGECLISLLVWIFVVPPEKQPCNHLLELCLPDSYSGGKGAGDLSLSVEAIEALGFIFAGSIDKNRWKQSASLFHFGLKTIWFDSCLVSIGFVKNNAGQKQTQKRTRHDLFRSFSVYHWPIPLNAICRSVLSLHKIASMQPLHQQSGYSKVSKRTS